MEVIAYVRVSTEGQEDKYGLDVQRNAIQEYADKNGYAIKAWYTDVTSGANAKRPELSLALHDESKSKAVLVFKNINNLIHFLHLLYIRTKNIFIK